VAEVLEELGTLEVRLVDTSRFDVVFELKSIVVVALADDDLDEDVSETTEDTLGAEELDDTSDSVGDVGVESAEVDESVCERVIVIRGVVTPDPEAGVLVASELAVASDVFVDSGTGLVSVGRTGLSVVEDVFVEDERTTFVMAVAEGMVGVSEVETRVGRGTRIAVKGSTEEVGSATLEEGCPPGTAIRTVSASSANRACVGSTHLLNSTWYQCRPACVSRTHSGGRQAPLARVARARRGSGVRDAKRAPGGESACG
jgi:hypothetical protein